VSAAYERLINDGLHLLTYFLVDVLPGRSRSLTLTRDVRIEVLIKYSNT